ncbi:GDP-L-fucose synthase family protein [Legionella feeleii]|uniref:GDP-L-fucose synthase n=2 Tax=Legionella TaxID=445 RepID=A0A0W0U0D4_9GAMM|nr:GDP-L-fucose synthase [Legionella feeleii]KTD01476.1 bifunctional GDP-fucose synthetase [Legionella feeleii]SPX61286.1 bifunctional GDP-fucose synthetase [Legionella feeleii]
MHHNAKIYVAGHRGLVGSALVRALERQGYTNLLLRTKSELDLTDQAKVHAFFAQERPEYVFMAAAKVGGIVANNTYPADFGYQNQIIQTNLIHASWENKVKRLLFLGSSCLYPRDCPQPMCEEHLLTGPLEPTNKAYALAKISGISMCDSFNRQYGTKYLVAMPTNLYGPNDNYDLQASHVIPALMRKIHEAKISHAPFVDVWGSGAPKREFMHSDDMGDAAIFLLNLPDAQYDELLHCPVSGPLVNIGYGKDISIKELVELLCRIVDYKGEVRWDSSKPDGTPKKLLNTDKISKTGWQPKLVLADELKKIYFDKFVNENKVSLAGTV